MKIKTRLILVLAVGLFAALNLTAQKPADLQGTWFGPATLEGMSEPNDFTLVLEMKEGKLTGHMTDQYSTMNENLILAEGRFVLSGSMTFDVTDETAGDLERFVGLSRSRRRQAVGVVIAGIGAFVAAVILVLVVNFFRREDVRDRINRLTS